MWGINSQTCKSSLQCSCPASPGSSNVLSCLVCRNWNWAGSENAGSPGRLSYTGRTPASQPLFQAGLNKSVLLLACKASPHTEEQNRTGQMAPASDYTLHPGRTVSSPVRRKCLGLVLNLGTLRDKAEGNSVRVLAYALCVTKAYPFISFRIWYCYDIIRLISKSFKP